jgi:energy-coupling factor transporter transmembrane protein EcfT
MPEIRGFKSLFGKARDLISLTVPAVVLTTRRAWAITEAATARGFESPRRNPYHVLAMQPRDWALIAASLLVVLFFFWR